MTVEELLAIRVSITDREAIKRLPRAGVIAYLEAHGWHNRTEWGEFRWEHALAERWVAITPPHFGDYLLRLSEVLHECGHVEKRSELAIYAEMMVAT